MQKHLFDKTDYNFLTIKYDGHNDFGENWSETEML